MDTVYKLSRVIKKRWHKPHLVEDVGFIERPAPKPFDYSVFQVDTEVRFRFEDTSLLVFATLVDGILMAMVGKWGESAGEVNWYDWALIVKDKYWVGDDVQTAEHEVFTPYIEEALQRAAEMTPLPLRIH